MDTTRMGQSPHPALEALFNDPRTNTPAIALRPSPTTIAAPPGTEASAKTLRAACEQLLEDAAANAWAIEALIGSMLEDEDNAARQTVDQALEAFQDLLEGQAPDPTQRYHAETLLMWVEASNPHANEQQAITALGAWLDGRRPGQHERPLCEAFVESIEDQWLDDGPPRALEAIIETLDGSLQDETVQTLVTALGGLIDSEGDGDSGPSALMQAGELLEGRGDTVSQRALALALAPEKASQYTVEDVVAIEHAPVVVLIPIDHNHVRFLCCRDWDLPHAADQFLALARSQLAITGASAYAALFQLNDADDGDDGEPNLYTLEYLHCNRLGVVSQHGEPLLCEGEPVGPNPLSAEAVDSLSRLLEPNGACLGKEAGDVLYPFAPEGSFMVDLALD